MKRSQLKRNTPLKSKTGLKRTQMKRRPKKDAEYSRFMKQFSGKPCSICNKKNVLGETTSAHHILCRSTHPEYRITNENCITLCVICHRHAHDYPGAFLLWLKENRPEQHEWVEKHRNHRR